MIAPTNKLPDQAGEKLMRKLLLSATFAACLTLGPQVALPQQAAQSTAHKAFKELQRQDVEALLATPGQVLVLDIRSPGEIAYWGAFPIFLNIETAESDKDATAIEKHLAEIPKDKQIMIVSGRANTTGFAAAVLARHGYKLAGSVGAMTFAEQGGHLVTFKPYYHWSMNGGKPPNNGNPTAARDEPKVFKELHRADVEAILAQPDSVLILDVRAPGEIAYWGGFPAYLDVQSDEGDKGAKGIEDHVAEIPRDKPIVTVSGRANRSGFAASVLEKNGFKVLGAVGAMTVEEEGAQLVKDAPYKPPTPKP
jgi:rhodanese-related sulfurtransferase